MTRPTIIVAGFTDGGTRNSDALRAAEFLRTRFSTQAHVKEEHPQCAADVLESIGLRSAVELEDALLVLSVGGPTAVANAFDPKCMSPPGASPISPIDGLALQVLLQFPQVVPVFLVERHPSADEVLGSAEDPARPTGVDELLWTPVRAAHFVEWSASNSSREQALADLVSRFIDGVRTTFDFTGLRTLLRWRFLANVFGRDSHLDESLSGLQSHLLGRLDHCSVCVDEERDDAYLAAYSAYKFGHRAAPVFTLAALGHIVTRSHEICSPRGRTEKSCTIIRDLDLRFPDLPARNTSSLRRELADVHSSKWKEILTPYEMAGSPTRYDPALRVRVLSTGYHIYPGPTRLVGLDHQLGQARAVSDILERLSGVPMAGARKPLETLYAVRALLDDVGGRRTRSFISVVTKPGGYAKGHAAHYVNLQIAQQLLEQATKCNAEKAGLRTHVLGAVLAQDAYLLLMGMSRTVSLRALLLMHSLEVRGEVEYPGISEIQNIEDRECDVHQTILNLHGGKPWGQVLRQLGTDLVKTLSTTGGSFGTRLGGWRDEAIVHIYRAHAGLQSVAVSRFRSFYAQFWGEMRVIYRNGEQFEAAERSNIEAIVHSGPLSGLGAGRCLRRGVALLGTSFRHWARAAVASFLAIAATYWYAGCVRESWWTTETTDPTQCAANGFLDLLLQVLGASLGLNPLATLAGAPYSPTRAAIEAWHFATTYVLFGLLISIIIRKLTKGG